MRRILMSLVLGAGLVGCRSYEIVRSNIFSDDDGRVVRIDYGRSEKPHVNTFISPSNGEKLEFRSKLVIDVVMWDDTSFTAWQCMNFLQSGTMYKTDNEKWLVLVNGFTANVYRQSKSDPTMYGEVYSGVLCDSPKLDRDGSEEKWRSMRKDANGRWR